MEQDRSHSSRSILSIHTGLGWERVIERSLHVSYADCPAGLIVYMVARKLKNFREHVHAWKFFNMKYFHVKYV